MHRRQLTVFFILLSVYALSAFVTYAFFADEIAAAGVHFWTDVIFHVLWGLI